MVYLLREVRQEASIPIFLRLKIIPLQHQIFFALMIMGLGGCFQTEPSPVSILAKSHVQYSFTRWACSLKEKVEIQVPKSIVFDSAVFWITDRDSQAIRQLVTNSHVIHYRDTVTIWFLFDRPEYTVICSTYYKGRLVVDSMDLSAGGLRDSLVLPESLFFHIGSHSLRYGYDVRTDKYRSRSLLGVDLVNESWPNFVFHGRGLDSITWGGRMPPQPFLGVSGEILLATDTLDLSTHPRVAFPEDRNYQLNFIRSGTGHTCATVEQHPRAYGPELDSLNQFLSFSQNAASIRLSRDPDIPPRLCAEGDCRLLDWAH